LGYQDRPYYRDQGGGGFAGNPLMWIFTGSVPLFTAFGIRVRAHASLILTIVLVLLFGLGQGATVQDRVSSMTMLFLVVLLHEFGHCFAARWVGGEAEDILMHPLGGLAFARPPHRPLPTFITVAGGPMVNVIICLVCGVALYAMVGWNPTNPFQFVPPKWGNPQNWFAVVRHVYWLYQVSLVILMFNLLPIFPLDGGQLVQSILWPIVGYYKSMNFSCIVGMVAAIVGGMIALATGAIGLAILATMGFLTCMNLRRQLLAAGPEAVSDVDYSAAYDTGRPKKNTFRARRDAARYERAKNQEQAVQAKVDRILAKVAAKGMNSLNWWEKRTLRIATERQRQADQQRKQRRGY
jgi:Zn-dependent protease